MVLNWCKLSWQIKRQTMKCIRSGVKRLKSGRNLSRRQIAMDPSDSQKIRRPASRKQRSYKGEAASFSYGKCTTGSRNQMQDAIVLRSQEQGGASGVLSKIARLAFKSNTAPEFPRSSIQKSGSKSKLTKKANPRSEHVQSQNYMQVKEITSVINFD